MNGVDLELQERVCFVEEMGEVVIELERGDESAKTVIGGGGWGVHDPTSSPVDGDLQGGELGHVGEGSGEFAVEGAEEI